MKTHTENLLPDHSECLKILEETGISEGVITHSLAVTRAAETIAHRILELGKGEPILKIIVAGAMLHDIGRSRTHGVQHGFIGGTILKELGIDARVVRIAERHVGAGIPREEAKLLGLPPQDFVPETLEERIVCYADKLAFGSEIKSCDETIRAFERELGAEHLAVLRLREFCKAMKKLLE